MSGASFASKFPVYQIDFSATAAGKRVASTKRKIRWYVWRMACAGWSSIPLYAQMNLSLSTFLTYCYSILQAIRFPQQGSIGSRSDGHRLPRRRARDFGDLVDYVRKASSHHGHSRNSLLFQQSGDSRFQLDDQGQSCHEGGLSRGWSLVADSWIPSI